MPCNIDPEQCEFSTCFFITFHCIIYPNGSSCCACELCGIWPLQFINPLHLSLKTNCFVISFYLNIIYIYIKLLPGVLQIKSTFPL